MKKLLALASVLLFSAAWHFRASRSSQTDPGVRPAAGQRAAGRHARQPAAARVRQFEQPSRNSRLLRQRPRPLPGRGSRVRRQRQRDLGRDSISIAVRVPCAARCRRQQSGQQSAIPNHRPGNRLGLQQHAAVVHHRPRTHIGGALPVLHELQRRAELAMRRTAEWRHFLPSRAGRCGSCNLQQPDFRHAQQTNNIIFRIPTPTFGAGLIEYIDDSTLHRQPASAGRQQLWRRRRLQPQRQ